MIHAWYFIPNDFPSTNSDHNNHNNNNNTFEKETFTKVPICDVSYLMKTGCGDDWTIWTGLFELLLGEKEYVDNANIRW